MKKLLILLTAGAFISMSLISCSGKCGRCEVNGTVGTKHCSADNHAVYDAAVASCVTGSGTWNTE
jgi:hypothetical protein